MSAVNDWRAYTNTGATNDGITRLLAPPPWRAFDADPDTPPQPAPDYAGWFDADLRRAKAYRARPELITPVNAALQLRRPLLISGKPGVGKSTLAFAVAFELGLGPVLRWPVTSRSTLAEGLYQYDAIGRLQDVNLAKLAKRTDIGRYIRLGPLGTALTPTDTPRVLLIDEVDKADLDLPNDLLTVFEEGRFEISELARIADDEPQAQVLTADPGGRTTVHAGQVRCRQFPFVVITSNGEREFPQAFLRRCLRIDIMPPDRSQLEQIVSAHLGPDLAIAGASVIDSFHQRSQEGALAADQLLNAVHLTCQAAVSEEQRVELVELLLSFLNSSVVL